MASEQDISLVFGVQVEGSSDGPGSMKLISDQLSAIVDAINKEPFKIKFEADPASLEAIKVKLQEITNLTSKKITWFDVAEAGGTGSASYYIDDIVKSLGNMESTMKMTLDSSTHSFGIFQEQLIEVNRLLDIISRKELEVYNSYGGYGGGMTSDEAADLRSIAANIQTMCDGLSEFKQILIDIVSITQQINAKDFNITNKFSVEKMDNVRRELTLQREEMIELYNVTERYSKVFQDVVGAKGTNGVRTAMTSVTGGNDIYKMIYALENTGITLSKINKEKNAVNFDVMKRQLLDLLNTYKGVLEYINAESDKKIDLPSLAALDDARAKLESFTEAQDKYNQSMREATATAMGAKIDQGSGTVAGSGMGAVTNQVTEQVAAMAGNVSTTLQDIKSQIESTFNISSFGFDSTKITEIFQSITAEFNSFKELVKAGIEELRQAAIEAFSSMTGKDGAFSSDSLKAYLKDLNEVSTKQAEVQKAAESLTNVQRQVKESPKMDSAKKAEEEQSYALAISERTKAQDAAAESEERAAKASMMSDNIRKDRQITERQFLDIYRQIHAALRENASVEGSEQFDILSKNLDFLDAVLQRVRDNSLSLENAFRSFKVTGLDALEALKTDVSAFNLEMELTGLKGSTSASQVYKAIAQMKTVIADNKGLAGTETYDAIVDRMTRFDQAIKMVESDLISVDNALEAVNITSSDAISGTTLLINKFRSETAGMANNTASLQQAYEMLNKLKKAMGSKSGSELEGTNTFTALEISASNFSDAIKIAERDTISIDEAFKRVKYSADEAFKDAELSLLRFNNAIASTDIISLKDAYTLLNKAQKEVDSNKNLVNEKTYRTLKDDVDLLRQAVETADQKMMSLNEAFSLLKINGQDVVDRVNLGMLRLKDTISQTGISGSLSVEQIEKKLISMNNLLAQADKIPQVTKGQEYTEIQSQILKFRDVLSTIKNEGISVEEAMRRIWTNGASFIGEADSAIVKLKLALSSAAPAAKALADAEAKASKESKEYQIQLAKAFSLLSSMEDAANKWTAARSGKSNVEYTSIANNISVLKNLIAQYKSGNMAASEFKQKIIEIQNSFRTSSETIRSAGENTKSFSDQIKGVAQRFGAWFGVTRVIMYVYRTMRQMVSASIELDDAMAQLKIVTQESDSAYEKFGNTIASVAKRTASSIPDIISSATTYARLGYSLEESTKIAEYTAKLQNVGDIDVADAQNAITSILKAYDEVDADHIEDVMNKLVVTGNNFPISVSQIAEGMNNASSALAAAGNTFEQSVALLTAANTTVNLCRVA